MLIDFLSLPTILLCSITMLISAGFSILALHFLRRRIPWEFFRDSHEVGGFLFNALGLIYAVLIAFVVYVTWDEYKSASHYTNMEAVTLNDIFLDAEGLPEPVRTSAREKILAYTNMVIDEDWPLLSIGRGNPKSRDVLYEIWKIFLSIDRFNNPNEQLVMQEIIKKVNDVTDYRRLRIMSSETHVPVVIWTVIIIGAMTSICFSLFFGSKNLKVQSIMTALFAMTNAIIILLILILDHPFTGDIKITSEPFIHVRDRIQEIMSK